MKCKSRKFLVYSILMQMVVLQVSAQLQSCPVNINFASGDLANWSAATGLVNNAKTNYPAPNVGVSTIPEYTISTTGIQVITTASSDLYGGFATIPTINGYAYNYSILLGSTATSYDLHSTSNNPGGFERSVSYTINVPAGLRTDPYTMTYAYAMVLENGTHNSNQQPLFKATLTTHDSVISCASPQYYLPTFNNAGSGNGNGSTGATLDSATARSNGFTNSPVLFLSHGGQGRNTGTYLQDVWTKGWTEVTFDLSAYRGQLVTLTFEADNCVPGGHFAYAYVALRNSCAGLQISGNPVACTNSKLVYSIPALSTAQYTWTVPAGWTIDSGANTNSITVTPGATGGFIIAREVNGCADLTDTLSVSTSPPTVAGKVGNDNVVCSGLNNTVLTLTGQTGQVLNWLSSPDGISWTAIANTGNSYTARNLLATTQFKALVQNGSSCNTDSSAAAIIMVNPQSKGGALDPANMSFCAGQIVSSKLTLTGGRGSVVNWQSSPDKANWSNFSPVKTDSTLTVEGINATTYYRTVVQSGVCTADTSEIATIAYVNVPFPAAAIEPDSTVICYRDSAQLHATIGIGTSYTWTSGGTLFNKGDGTVPSLPFMLNAIAKPVATTNYILNVTNAGCPNVLHDTFHVAVTSPIIVFAGNDTSIVAGQPLQLRAAVNDPLANQFTWTPSTSLNFSNIYNPVATLGAATGSITYEVKAANVSGCYGRDDIKVTVFKTAPDIFVPNAFTPNSDGHNDVIRPVYAGISQLNFFRIYNRWGQLVFSTTETGKGWDGTIGGIPQPTGTFVFTVQAMDYQGRSIIKKGTVILVR